MGGKKKSRVPRVMLAFLAGAVALTIYSRHVARDSGSQVSRLLREAARKGGYTSSPDDPYEVIRRLKGAAIPDLIAALKTPDSRLHEMYERMYPRLPKRFAAELPDPVSPSAIRITAASLLLGSLIEQRETGQSSSEAVAAVPALVECSHGTNKIECSMALRILAVIGQPAIAAKPRLLEMLRDPDEEIRLNVLETLGAISPESPQIMPKIQSLLANSTNSWTISRASRIAGRGEVSAQACVPILLKRMLDTDPALASQAGLMIESFLMDPRNGETQKTSIPGLIAALKGAGVSGRASAARVFGYFTIPAPEAVPALEAMLKDDVFMNRSYAAKALKRIANRPYDAWALLREGTNDPNATVRADSGKMLKSIEEFSARKQAVLAGRVAGSNAAPSTVVATNSFPAGNF